MVDLLASGLRDKKIVIETPSESQGTDGSVTYTWATFATVWANVRPILSRDRFMSQAEHSTRVATFFVPFLSGLDEKMRISYDGLYWQIKAISEMGRRRGHEIAAEVIR